MTANDHQASERAAPATDTAPGAAPPAATDAGSQDAFDDAPEPNPLEPDGPAPQPQPPSPEHPERQIRGHFDRISDGWASGWLFDPETPERRLDVEVRCDDRVVARGPADLARDDLVAAGIGDGAHAFMLKLEPDLFDGAPHVLTAVAAESGEPLRGGPIELHQDAAARSAAAIRGHLDRIGDGAARGWAFDPSRPEQRLGVSILADGRVIASGVADQFRQDLLDAGLGDGRYAFALEVDTEALDASAAQPSAQVSDPEVALPGPPPVTDAPASAAQQAARLSPSNPPQPPFENTRDTRFFFPSSAHAEALSRLFLLTQDRNMGIGVLTGEIGSGKTLLRTLLYARLNNDQHLRVSIENSLLDFDGLLLEILSQMQGERLAAARFPDRYTRLAAFKRFLSEQVASRDRHLVVLIDEAQHLSAETLEALKGLTNIASERQNFLTLILIGQPELRARLKQLPQVDQRVSLRFHLKGLDRAETGYYVRHRLRVAGFRGEPPVSEPALDLLHQSTRGIPREINRLCKLALDHVLTYDDGELNEQAIGVIVNDLRRHGALEAIADEL